MRGEDEDNRSNDDAKNRKVGVDAAVEGSGVWIGFGRHGVGDLLSVIGYKLSVIGNRPAHAFIDNSRVGAHTFALRACNRAQRQYGCQPRARLGNSYQFKIPVPSKIIMRDELVPAEGL